MGVRGIPEILRRLFLCFLLFKWSFHCIWSASHIWHSLQYSAPLDLPDRSGESEHSSKISGDSPVAQEGAVSAYSSQISGDSPVAQEGA